MTVTSLSFSCREWCLLSTWLRNLRLLFAGVAQKFTFLVGRGHGLSDSCNISSPPTWQEIFHFTCIWYLGETGLWKHFMGNRWENNGSSGWLYFWGSKITADGDCSHDIKRCLLLGRKVLTNPDSILKSRDITLPTKVCLVKAMTFPVVMYGCESWTVKKAEHQRIDVFELCCWRRLLRFPWTARRSNQSILKDISPEYSLEGLMLKLKL